MTKTFYAIYDVHRKLFKGRGNMSGVRWTESPTQTYDKATRALSAMKAHMKIWNRHSSVYEQRDKYLVVIPVTVSWPDDEEILESLYI